jgi:hypothetical protein
VGIALVITNFSRRKALPRGKGRKYFIEEGEVYLWILVGEAGRNEGVRGSFARLKSSKKQNRMCPEITVIF